MTPRDLIPSRRATTVLVALAALAAQPRPGRADEPTDDAAQRVYFEEGRAHVKVGRYAEALESFQRSLAIRSGSGILLNIGDCYEKLGKYASAVSSFEQARLSAAEKRQPEREREAVDRLARIRPILSSITVAPITTVEAVITIDGKPVDAGRPTAVDGGSHVVKIAPSCRLPRERTVQVALRSDAVTVTFDERSLVNDPACAPLKEVARPASGSPDTDRHASEAGARQRLIALVAGGAGIVALGAGTAFGLVASGYRSDLDAACPRYPSCASADRGRVDGLYDDATGAATIATISFATAAVLLGAAAVLWFTAPRASEPQRAASLRTFAVSPVSSSTWMGPP